MDILNPSEKLVNEVNQLIEGSLRSLNSGVEIPLPTINLNHFQEKSEKRLKLTKEFSEKISLVAETTAKEFDAIASEMDLHAEKLRLWLADAKALRQELKKAILPTIQ